MFVKLLQSCVTGNRMKTISQPPVVSAASSLIRATLINPFHRIPFTSCSSLRRNLIERVNIVVSNSGRVKVLMSADVKIVMWRETTQNFLVAALVSRIIMQTQCFRSTLTLPCAAQLICDGIIKFFIMRLWQRKILTKPHKINEVSRAPRTKIVSLGSLRGLLLFHLKKPFSYIILV